MIKEKAVANSEDEIYAALNLIRYLCRTNKIKKHIFINILKEYKDVIDISEFYDIIDTTGNYMTTKCC